MLSKIEKTLDDVEKRLHNCDTSIRSYRNVVSSKASDGYSSLESTAANDIDAEKDHTRKKRESSLFDGLLRDFIRECTFEINPDTEEETNYTIIRENTSDSVVELDVEGNIVSVNPAFTKIFSYRESELEGSSFLSLVPEEYHKGIRDAMARALREKLDTYVDSVDDIVVFRATTKEGEIKSLEGLLYAYRKDDNLVLVLLIRDLTYNRSLFEELQEAKENYDALSETISETIIRLDEDFIVFYANNAVRKTFGYSKEEVMDQHFSLLFPPGVFARSAKEFRKYLFIDEEDRKEWGLDITIEVLGKSKNRGIFPMEMSFGNSKDLHGRTMTCILRDITQRKHNERKLRHLAYHDKLTGLGNRDLFNKEIRSVLKTLREHAGLRSALMFLDLDGFKQINDTLGHEAGDKLLIETARRLRSNLRESDSVYRFGGDEFVVLLSKIKKRENAAKIAAKLLRAVREAYRIEQEENTTFVNVGVSIGIAVLPEDGDIPDVLTKHADLAMYSAKESGKNQYIFYSPEMDRRAVEKWELEQGLKKSLAQRELMLNYQPILNLQREVLGVEALARWRHPEFGLVPPSTFIPAAEESGLILPMGNWILENACRHIRYLNENGYNDLFVSVNISPKQFEHPDFLDMTGNIVRRTGIDSRNLKFELTETSIMNAPESAIEKMNALKEQHPGIMISIDDFGTGYSSLSYLSKFPADIIKIDHSFVTRLFHTNNLKIVNAIVNLAQSLELEVVAEGVETKEQFDFFVEKGCAALQGHYFSKAVPFEELRAFMKENDPLLSEVIQGQHSST